MPSGVVKADDLNINIVVLCHTDPKLEYTARVYASPRPAPGTIDVRSVIMPLLMISDINMVEKYPTPYKALEYLLWMAADMVRKAIDKIGKNTTKLTIKDLCH